MRLLALALPLAACGMQDPTTVEQQDGACIALEGRRFESVNELECGLTPTGPQPCKWHVSFAVRDDASSTFQWQYADVGESGMIECHGETITTLTGSLTQRQITGTFDHVAQKLVWEGQTYAPAN